MLGSDKTWIGDWTGIRTACMHIGAHCVMATDSNDIVVSSEPSTSNDGRIDDIRVNYVLVA